MHFKRFWCEILVFLEKLTFTVLKKSSNRAHLGTETDKTINGANMIWGNNLLKGFCPYLHQGYWIALLSHLHSSFTHRSFHYTANDHTMLFSIHPVWVCVPVRGCWKDPQDDVSALHAYDGAGGLQQVEVEVRVSGDWAVQTRFQKRRPLAL